MGPAAGALGGQVHDAVPLPTLGAGVSGPDEPEAPKLPPAFSSPGLNQPNRPGRLSYSAPSDDASGKAIQRTSSADEAEFAKVGRNAPCPCGSGKKFKLCHGDPRKR